MRSRDTLTLVSLTVALVGLSAPASALTIPTTWNFGGSCTSTSGGTTFGNSCSISAGGVTDKATAWSTTAGTTNTQLETAYLGVYSGGGLGVTNRDGVTSTTSPCGTDKDCGEGIPGTTVSPEHATDNNERYDAVLFNFTDNVTSAAQKVQLTQVALGFPPVNGTSCSSTVPTCDSDITVLAYTGSGTPAALSSISAFSYTQMTAAGWTLVGNYADVADTPTRTANINPSLISSAYWIVAAFDPNLSDPSKTMPCTQVGTTTYSSGCTTGNDYVKILSVTTNPPPTKKAPEPNTLLLLGFAGTIGVWTRRRLARG